MVLHQKRRPVNLRRRPVKFGAASLAIQCCLVALLADSYRFYEGFVPSMLCFTHVFHVEIIPPKRSPGYVHFILSSSAQSDPTRMDSRALPRGGPLKVTAAGVSRPSTQRELYLVITKYSDYSVVWCGYAKGLWWHWGRVSIRPVECCCAIKTARIT